MRLKKAAFVTLAAGIASLLVVFCVPYASIMNGGTVGIIGGAKWPTFWLLARYSLGGLRIALLLLGAALTVTGLFCLLFGKTVAKTCSVKTSAISLALSLTGAVGLGCFFLLYAMVVFHETSKHPITHPASIILGLLCLTAFVILLGLYWAERRKIWSPGGLVIDIATAVLYFPFFFYGFSCAYEMGSRLVGGT